MKRIWERTSGIALSLFEILLGVLLLVEPVGFTRVMLIGTGWLLMALGLWSVVRYFLMDAQPAAQKQLLFKGLCAALAGLFAVLCTDWILSVFPLLAMLYGVGILLMGLRRVQWTLDLIRLKKKRWYWPAIGALLAIAVSVIILFNPFATVEVLWVFVGISLLTEAAVDIVTFVFSWIAMRRLKKSVQADPAA